MLEYEFMQRALLAGCVLAIALPLIGVTLVLRRTSMTGDALAHASLAGVAAGLLTSWDPVLGALISGIIAAITIELVRRKMPQYADVAIAVVSAVGAGLAGILSSMTGNTRSLDSFLFGSIVTVSNTELLLVVGLGIVVVAFAYLCRRALLLLALDARTARTSGVRVAVIEIIFAVVTGVVVSISARTIGSLVVSSMLVVPVACALQLSRSYKSTIAIALVVSLVSVVLGLTASYYLSFKPGGTIVLLTAAILVASLIVKQLRVSKA